MPSPTAPGPHGGSESIKDLIRANPSILEDGLRILDVDLRAGDTGTIDAVGIDRSGGLTLVVLDGADPEAALVRLLDAQIWSSDQRDLLARLYASDGVDLDRPVRGLLLCSSFTHTFLRRLSLLTADVTAFLARVLFFEDGPRVAIERAAPLFGLARNAPPHQDGRPHEDVRPDEVGRPRQGGNGADASGPDRRPFWPDGVLPPEEDMPAAATTAAAAVVSVEEPLWPGSPDEIAPWDQEETPLDVMPDRRRGAAAPVGTFETLTAEEMEEFDRFEQQKGERDRRST